MKAFTKILICVALGLVISVSSAFGLDPRPTRKLVTDTATARALKTGAMRTMVVGQEYSPVTNKDEPVFRNVIRVAGIGDNPNDTAVVVDLGPEYMNVPQPPPPPQPKQPNPPVPQGATFTVKVEWDAQADIDLWVTEPGNANKIYYRNKNGVGNLSADNTRGGSGSFEQYAVMNGPRGPYKIEVNYFVPPNGPRPTTPVNVRVTIERPGQPDVSINEPLNPGGTVFVFRGNGAGFEP